MPLVKKFIGDDEVTGEKILLENNEALRMKNAASSAVDVMKLDGSDVLQMLQVPRVPSDASNDNDLVRKSQVDTGLSAKLDSSLKGAANGLAELDSSSKIPSAQLPALALTTTSVVANEAAQLALTVEEGDVAVRNDLNKSFIALNADNVDMDDWQELKSPTAAVSSVVGETGAITAAQVKTALEGESDYNNFSDADHTKLDGIASGATANADTDALSEGSSNLYHTAQRAVDALVYNKESLTLSSGDITNQYKDCAFEIKANSMFCAVKDGDVGLEGYHYTLSGSPTRITLAGPWATSGSSELVADDVLYIQYLKKTL